MSHDDHHGAEDSVRRVSLDVLALARRLCLLGFATGAIVPLGSVAHAANYYFAVDVPSRLGGTDYTPNQLVRSLNAIYAVDSSLPTGTSVAALHVLPSGVWRLTPALPVTLGSTVYEPRDVVSWNGATYSLALDGSAVGIPSHTRIDALFLDAAGLMILSFDVPVNLAGIEYSPSDLVRYDAGFSLYKDAEASGIPATSNLVGAALGPTGELVVTFDVPTRLGATDYLPGQLVLWSGTSFTAYYSDVSWPVSSQLRDFVFLPPAGSVPDGGPVPGTALTALREPSGDVTLNWGSSCTASDTDYEIYEGSIGGAFTNHISLSCTTGGATTKTFTPGAGNRYYLVVPRNTKSEGSYGVSSAGMERAAGVVSCLPRQTGPCL